MRHISIEKEENRVWVVTFNSPDSSVNVLSSALFAEVEGVMEEMEKDRGTVGMVLISGKEGTFVAGADLDELKAKKTPEEVRSYVKRANTILSRLEAWDKPVVCAIHGACLGGGLELALACDYRIASEAPETVFGLPEVKLGLFPAGGGTQRLPRLIGLSDALPFMLTGKQLRFEKAKKLGLIDEVVNPFVLKDAAIGLVQKLAGKSHERKMPNRSLARKVLESTKPGRDLMFRMARKGVLKQTKGLYPSPLEIINSVKHGTEVGVEQGIERDIQRFGELALSPEAKGLMTLFHAMTGAGKGLVNGKARDVKKLAILGAGLMGNGVAGVSTGLVDTILLKDATLEGAAKGVQEVRDGLAKRACAGGITAFQKETLGASVVPCTDFSAFKGTDLVIEAVFEDLNLKRSLLKEVEETCGEKVIFASNTSSLPISEIAEGCNRPEHVIGMHYFSPVRSMPLLEIITTDKTADWVVETAIDFGMKQGKTCIVVKDGPAFYTTRILTMMLNEVLLLVEEGVGVRKIDEAMMTFGYPVGPITLMDEIGFDVGVHVGEVMTPTAQKRRINQSTVLKTLYDKGLMGRKNGRGFYDYAKKRRKGKLENKEVAAILGNGKRKKIEMREIQERIGLTMINEAILCLEEGIIASPTDGDLGAVLGLGFPPFTGGPFSYVDSQGTAKILKTMEALNKRFGARFKPADLLKEKAGKNQNFY